MGDINVENAKWEVAKAITKARQSLLILSHNMNLPNVDAHARFMDCYNAMTEVNKLSERINQLSILYARMVK